MAEFWVLVDGNELQLVDNQLHRGYFHPRHRHPKNHSVGYVVSGRLQVGIGDEEFVLGPGDSWRVDAGVHHWTRALEDTIALEVYTPPRADYSGSA